MLRPLGDRVLVRVLEKPEQTKGGVFLPDVAQDTPDRGEVVATGPGLWYEGERIPVEVSVGDVVLFGKFAGTEIKVDQEDILVLRESDIIGIEE